MQQQQIHLLDAERGERALDRVEDVRAATDDMHDPMFGAARRTESNRAFRHQLDFAAERRSLFQRSAEQRLGLIVAVDVGVIEGGDPQRERGIDEAMNRLEIALRLRDEAPATGDQSRQANAAVSERDSAHLGSLIHPIS